MTRIQPKEMQNMNHTNTRCAFKLSAYFILLICFIQVVFHLQTTQFIIGVNNYREDIKQLVVINKTFQEKMKSGLIEQVNHTTPKQALMVNSSYLVNEKNKEIKNNADETKSLDLINKRFEVKLKPGIMELVNATIPKYAFTVSYYLENKNLCSSERDLTVMIIILSAPGNFQRRNFIRETWGNSSFYISFGKVKVMFLLGRTLDRNIQNEITDEFKRNGDILQGEIIDSYHNLTHKTVMGYKWLTERCRNVKYVIKADDDIVLDVFLVFQNIVPNMTVDQYHVHCFRYKGAHVFRTKDSKFYVEPNQFRGATYLPYCFGPYVLILNDIVPSLYKSASISPFFWIDDVFSYGIVMSSIPSLKFKEMRYDEYVSYSRLRKLHCWKHKLPRCVHYFITSDGDSERREIWRNLLAQYNTSIEK